MMRGRAEDGALDAFLRALQERLRDRLRQVILFGSRSRGDSEPDSDYDCLVILDEVSPGVRESIDEVVGQILYQYNAVFSVHPVSEERYLERVYDPLLMNVRREGITLWTKA